LRGAALLAHDPSNQADQRLAGTLNGGVNFREPLVVDEMQSSRGKELRFDFEERSSRMAEVLAPFAERQPPLPFRDAAGDADGSAPQLRDEPKALIGRKLASDLVDDRHEIDRALKRDQILK